MLILRNGSGIHHVSWPDESATTGSVPSIKGIDPIALDDWRPTR